MSTGIKVLAHLVVVGHSLCLYLVLSSDCGLCGAFVPALFSVSCRSGPGRGALSSCTNDIFLETVPNAFINFFVGVYPGHRVTEILEPVPAILG